MFLAMTTEETLRKVSPKNVVLGLSIFAVASVCLLTVAGFFGGVWWRFELASHFRMQYAAALAVSLPVAAVLKSRRLFAVSLLFCLVNSALVFPLYLGTDRHEREKPLRGELTVLLMNVNFANTDYKAAAEYIERMNPDILGIEELNRAWLFGLKDVLKEYPHGAAAADRPDAFGIGLFSRAPLDEVDLVHYGDANVPSVRAATVVGGRRVSILLTHPVPPASKELFDMRNSQFDEIARGRKEFGDRLIVFGDLNASPWSVYFSEFAKRMGLKDSRRGHGPCASWPVQPMALRIPLDYVLVSGGLAALESRIGPDIGSDHFPVFARVGIY